MTVRAPVGGRILSRSVRPGDVASPSNVMFTIAANQAVELDAEIPEQALSLVHVGQAATVTLPGGGTVDGRVRLLSAQIDPDTRLGRARVLLPVRSDLRPGGYAQAAFVTTSVPTLTVPDAAVTYSADGPSIMIVDRQRRVSQLTVRIGRRGGGRAELLNGPPAGTMVLVGSQDFVLPGDVVRPVTTASRGAVR
jgi:HlyD family secretion protein